MVISERIIQIDSNEPDDILENMKFLLSINSKMLEFKIEEVEKEKLGFGDMRLGSLGAERKKVEDFAGSIKDGRIFVQIQGMVNNYKYPYLLISGDLNKLKQPIIKGILTSVADFEARYGLRVRFLPSDMFLCYYFLMLCYKHSKKLDPNYKILRPKISEEDESIVCLIGIQNLGVKKAKALIEHFGSISKISKSTIKELMNINGIGKKLSKHILNVLNSK